MPISKSDFNFLTELEKNNNRDWFTENKGTYQASLDNIISFADEVLVK